MADDPSGNDSTPPQTGNPRLDSPNTTATIGIAPVVGEGEPGAPSVETRMLTRRYEEIVQHRRVSWTEHHRLVRRLGAGSHGLVYLSEGRGSDDFTLPVALKIFDPKRYRDERDYSQSMREAARVAALVANIQQDNVLHVHRWIDRGWVRVMEMEWIDGFDLQRLLTPAMLDRLQGRVTPDRWRKINDVVVTAGPEQPRLKTGVAVAVLRDCLAALDALHRARIIHADVKPANVMLKRTGDVKVIDLGSAFQIDAPPAHYTCTPLYAAPEVFACGQWTTQADLASLGYMFVELLAGQRPFQGINTYRELIEAKRSLPERLPEILPREVVRNDLLVNFCRRLIAPDPAQRFASAEQAELDHGGAAGFHRQLVKGDLASEYDKDMRAWLNDLGEWGVDEG